MRKLSFGEFLDSKFSGLYAFDYIAISLSLKNEGQIRNVGCGWMRQLLLKHFL